MMNYEALKTLMETHPQWDTVSDADLLAWVNEKVINVTADSVPNTTVLSVILANVAEFTALSDSDKQIVRDILYIGDSVPTVAGDPIRDRLVAIFTGGSDTIQALVVAITSLVSRAVNAGVLGQIKEGDIGVARGV
jgi:hypothetical protein